MSTKSSNASTLSEYVKRVMAEKRLSGYDIERIAVGRISQSHVNKIKNGQITSPTTTKLQALARGLGVQEAELFAAARGSGVSAEDLRYERLKSVELTYEKMTKKKREKADYVIDLLAREMQHILQEPE